MLQQDMTEPNRESEDNHAVSHKAFQVFKTVYRICHTCTVNDANRGWDGFSAADHYAKNH